MNPRFACELGDGSKVLGSCESAVPEGSKSTVRALPFVEILSGSDMLFSMILYHRFFVLMAKIDSYDRFGLWKFT